MHHSRLFVSNIAWETTEQDLRDLFEPFRCTSVNILLDRETGKPRGLAFVSFFSADDAEQARQLDGIELSGRRLYLRIAEDRPRAPRAPK